MKYPGKKISATLTLFSPLGQIHPLIAWPIFKYIQITLVLLKLRIAEEPDQNLPRTGDYGIVHGSALATFGFYAN
jgi:hypothetical protein